MHCRYCFLNPPALPAALVLAFLLPGSALAHRLKAQAFVLPNQRVQIESWFSTGDPARGARVEVLRADHQILTSGQMNEHGVFVFDYAGSGPLTVVVRAGAGHRAEVVVTAEELGRSKQQPEKTTTTANPNGLGEPVPLARREADLPIKDVLIGVAFLLALAAFVISLRNARKLRELRSRL
jgi:nickel transport protein